MWCDLRNNGDVNHTSFDLENRVCDGKRTLHQQHVHNKRNMSCQFQIDELNELIEEMDLQMEMALSYALDRTNDASSYIQWKMVLSMMVIVLMPNML